VRSLSAAGKTGESAWCKWKKGDCEHGVGKCAEDCGYLCGSKEQP